MHKFLRKKGKSNPSEIESKFNSFTSLLGFLFVAVTVKGFVDAETGMTAQPSFEIIGYSIARGKTLIVLYSTSEVGDDRVIPTPCDWEVEATLDEAVCWRNK